MQMRFTLQIFVLLGIAAMVFADGDPHVSHGEPDDYGAEVGVKDDWERRLHFLHDEDYMGGFNPYPYIPMGFPDELDGPYGRKGGKGKRGKGKGKGKGKKK